MTHVILTRPGTIDRDSDDRHIRILGTGLDFTELMIEVRKIVPDRRFEFFGPQTHHKKHVKHHEKL